MPVMDATVRALWFSLPNFFYLLPVPFLTGLFFVIIWIDLHRGREIRPFILSIGVFFLSYMGLAISLWPWIVPTAVTFREAAAAPESQSLLLIGTVFLLPMVLRYTAYCYYLFRGKATHETAY
jgi:cytochrome d ubiquinol oxidase subunit II